MEEQVTWLILTVVLNALVTGVIVSYFNNKLASTLGRENFEHQTKFADLYAKRVKALEGIFERFLSLSEVLEQTAQNIQAYKIALSEGTGQHLGIGSEPVWFDREALEERFNNFAR